MGKENISTMIFYVAPEKIQFQKKKYNQKKKKSSNTHNCFQLHLIMVLVPKVFSNCAFRISPSTKAPTFTLL